MKLRWLWNAWDYSCVIWCIWQISRVTNCTRKIFQGFVFEQTLLNFTRTSSQFQKCTFNTIYGKHWLLKNCCSRVTTFNFSGVNSCQHCQRFFPMYIFEVWMRTTKGTLSLQIEKKILGFFNNDSTFWPAQQNSQINLSEQSKEGILTSISTGQDVLQDGTGRDRL